MEITVSFLGIHKWEPDIYIGFSPALPLQYGLYCRGLNADVQAEAQEHGEGVRGVYTVQTLSFNYLDNLYFSLTYTL